jgi:N-acetylglucosaminyldiphosphoundecaprenol N-acetyl-beta-D-mannosaminyltransferase
MRLRAARVQRHVPQPGELEEVLLGGPNLSVRIHRVTQAQTVEVILSEIAAGRGGTVVTPNIDHLVKCRNELAYRALVDEASLVVADGMPLVWASWLQGDSLPERVSGSDLIFSLSEGAARDGCSIYLIGGDPGTADGTARILCEKYPGLKVAGTYYPEFGFEKDDASMAHLVDHVKAAAPDIVYVGLGCPKQENLIREIHKTLPRAWWLGVGISFSFVTGDVKRADGALQRYGLEWIDRMVKEPRRLMRRYLVDGIPFALRMLGGAAARGAAKRVRQRLRKKQEVVPVVSAIDEAAAAVGEQNARAVDEVQPYRATSSPARGPVHSRKAEAEQPAEVEVDSTDHPALPDVLSRIKAMVLLGGRGRSNPLTTHIQRPILELPLRCDENGCERVLDAWLRWTDGIAKAGGQEHLPVRIVVDAPEAAPLLPSMPGGMQRRENAFTCEVDRKHDRGTGGVLADVADQYEDDDLLLVAAGHQVMLDPPHLIARALAAKFVQGAEVALVADGKGPPSVVTLLRCGVLRSIKDIGFIDLKEQALPKLALTRDVRAVRLRRPPGLPIRYTDDYLQAIPLYNESLAGGRRLRPDVSLSMPMCEELDARFSVIEPGAEVHETARVHDAVVLAGAKVEAGATVVRSVVCAGAVIKRGTSVVDATVGADHGRRWFSSAA